MVRKLKNPNTIGELKANSRVVEGGRHVPVAEFPEGEYLVEYLGTPIKLLVIDNYKGMGKRYFFSTNTNDTPEDIITTWENRWDIEVVIRELKALGLEKSSFLTWVRNKGFITLKALSLLLVLSFKYSLGLRLGAKRISRMIKSISLWVGLRNCSREGKIHKMLNEITKGIPEAESYKKMLRELRKESNKFVHELYLGDVSQKLDYTDIILLVYAIKLLIDRGFRT